MSTMSIVPVDAASANYYFYTLKNNNDVLWWGYSYSSHLEANDYWRLIYVFALSSNLSNMQLANVFNAVKIPLDAYIMKANGNQKLESDVSSFSSVPLNVFINKMQKMSSIPLI